MIRTCTINLNTLNIVCTYMYDKNKFIIIIGVFNLRSTQRTADAITVVWDPAGSYNCGPVLYYIVTIRNLAIPCDANSFNLTLPRAKFHELINNVSYVISVGAVNRAGVGMETTINVTTLAVTTSETSQGMLPYVYHTITFIVN